MYDLGKKHGYPNQYDVTQMFTLAKALHINNSVRTTNDPLVGDLVFFDHTYDRNHSCSLGGNAQPTHVGIVTAVDPTNPARITLAHAGSIAKEIAMSRDQPADPALNGPVGVTWKCVDCSTRISGLDSISTTQFSLSCPIGQCSNRSLTTCEKNDFNNYGTRAGQLFSGYATIRGAQ